LILATAGVLIDAVRQPRSYWSKWADLWLVALLQARRAVSSGNQAWLEDIRPAVEDVQNRWQGPLVWGTLAEVYRALGDIESLRRHVEFVEALQPESGAKLRQHYRDLI
jgi:hypothetical protein